MKISTPSLLALCLGCAVSKELESGWVISQPVIMAILTQLGTEQNWEEEEEELWDEHYTAHFHTCFTTNGEQVYRFSQLSLNYYPKLYIPSTLNQICSKHHDYLLWHTQLIVCAVKYIIMV